MLIKDLMLSLIILGILIFIIFGLPLGLGSLWNYLDDHPKAIPPITGFLLVIMWLVIFLGITLD